ncbi:MAG: AAA family ATPase [Thermomicrobiales bacterium]
MDSGTPVVARTAGSLDALTPRAAPPLVGRVLEQLFLREELAAVLGGRGRLVLLDGEAGIGKTTLAEDLAAEAASRGLRVLTGACYDLTNTPPYGLWRNVFEVRARDCDNPPPPASFTDARLAGADDQASLFAEVSGFFRELASTGPALVVLEDLHWADPDSLQLLRYLAPRLRHWPILLLVTYRGDELTRRHPFAMQLPVLVREGAGLRLQLRRLDVAALGALVAARYRLPVADEARLVAYLDQHAEGNPFFTMELLHALHEDLVLRPVAEGWALGRLDRVVLPSLLRQVIDGRVARLDEAMQRAIAIAAVIGQEAPLALWADVAGLDDETVLTIVERAGDCRLLDATPDGRSVRFVHALTREALYTGVTPPRRRRWHQQVGETLAAVPQPNVDAVAYHFQAASDPRASEWLIAAGTRAQRAYAWLTAAERLRAAAALLDGVEGQEQVSGRLACRLAYLLRFSDPAAGIDALEGATRLARRIGDNALAAEARWLRGLLLCYADRFRDGVAEMLAGVAAIDTMPGATSSPSILVQAWLAEALPGSVQVDGARDARLDTSGAESWHGASMGRFLASAGHLRDAAESCARSVSLLTGDATAAKGSHQAAIAFASHGLGIARAGLGRPDEARTAFAQARSIFAALDHHALVAFTLLDELRDVVLTYHAAHPAERRQLAAAAEASLGRTGGALRPGVSPRLTQLGCLVLDGRWLEADDILRDLPDPGNAYFRRELTATRTMLAYHRGASGQVWDEILRLLPDGPATEPGDVIHQEGLFLQRLAADVCLDRNDLPAARAWLEAHDRWLAWSGSVLGAADGLVAWARYHWLGGEPDPARERLGNALALASLPGQPLVLLAAHRLLGEIEIAAKQYADAEEHLQAAIDLSITCDAPFERARSLLALAELRHASGQDEAISALLDEVSQICVPLGAAPAIARVEALASVLRHGTPQPHQPGGLTPRELQILRLLPRGLSNAEIADALFVSPRTIQSHLSNLYAKLEVRGRPEAVAYAVGAGLG